MNIFGSPKQVAQDVKESFPAAELRALIFIAVLLLAIGTVFYMWEENWDVLEAFYFLCRHTDHCWLWRFTSNQRSESFVHGFLCTHWGRVYPDLCYGNGDKCDAKENILADRISVDIREQSKQHSNNK